MARALEKHVYEGADQIVVTTLAMRDTIRERYQFTEKKIEVIPNYVQSEIFAPIQTKKQGKTRIFYLGRLAKEKNLNMLIKAMSGIESELWIAGDGYLRADLEELATSSKADVRFLAFVPNWQLPELLNSADIFVLPSLYEGHPKALIEAMSCGLAVIGSNVSGIKELIRHEENGLLAELSVESIRDSIIRLLEDDHLRTKLGKSARKTVLENFSLEKIVEQEHSLYKKMLGKDARD